MNVEMKTMTGLKKLLVKELPNFGYLTSLDIAVSADDQDFIAHTSCQTLLSRLWMGALYINTELWKVRRTLCVCFFLQPVFEIRVIKPIIVVFA